MANQLLTISMITLEALQVLENNLTFTKFVTRTYDDQFAKNGAKIGTTLNIRKPPRYQVTSGQGLQLQDVTETSVPLVLTTQAQRSFQFTSQDLTLSIDDFAKRFLKPAIASMANQIDYDGLGQWINVYNYVGTPGVTPTSLDTYLAAGVSLDDESTPRDDERSAVLSPIGQSYLVSATKGLFQSSTKIAEQYDTGTMGETIGFKFSMDQNVQAYTTGPLGGTPLVDGAGQTGSTVLTKGWTSSAAKRLSQGDIIQFAGVYAVNRQSYQSTGVLRNFLVTADVSSTSGGAATIPIYPAIITSGPFQTVTASPADSAVVTIYGSASAYASILTKQQLAFHEVAFAMASADLLLPGGVDMAYRAADKQLGMSIRIIRDYDINTDRFPCRLDMLYGWVTQYPECAVRIAS